MRCTLLISSYNYVTRQGMDVEKTYMQHFRLTRRENREISQAGNYGAVVNNGGGITEMAGLDLSIRDLTDALDALGNTIASTGNGFPNGGAVLTLKRKMMSVVEGGREKERDVGKIIWKLVCSSNSLVVVAWRICVCGLRSKARTCTAKRKRGTGERVRESVRLGRRRRARSILSCCGSCDLGGMSAMRRPYRTQQADPSF